MAKAVKTLATQQSWANAEAQHLIGQERERCTFNEQVGLVSFRLDIGQIIVRQNPFLASRYRACAGFGLFTCALRSFSPSALDKKSSSARQEITRGISKGWDSAWNVGGAVTLQCKILHMRHDTKGLT